MSQDKFKIERWKQFHAPNAAMLRLQLEQEGCQVYQWADLPGINYGLRKHESGQSYWVVSGALELTVGGKNYTLEAGDRGFLQAETWYTMRVISPEPVVYLIGEKILEQEKPKSKRRGKRRK